MTSWMDDPEVVGELSEKFPDWKPHGVTGAPVKEYVAPVAGEDRLVLRTLDSSTLEHEFGGVLPESVRLGGAAERRRPEAGGLVEIRSLAVDDDCA